VTLDVTLPDGADMECTVILPDGQSFALTEKAGRYIWKQ
jgi:hypothetical protein